MAEEEDEVKAVVTGKVIIAMKGHPGTGKSTLARAIASYLKIPIVDKDDIKDSASSLSSTISPSLLNGLSYDAAWRVASSQLGLGLSVVVDSPLSRKALLDRLIGIASSAGARVVIVECKPLDEAEWRKRIERRKCSDDASWHKPSTWRDVERLLEGYGGCTEYDVGDVPKLILDTTGPVDKEELVSSAVEFIVSHGGSLPKH